MEEVVGGRKSKIEHFVAEEADNTDGEQDDAAQKDVGFREVSLHSLRLRWAAPSLHDRSISKPSRVAGIWLEGSW